MRAEGSLVASLFAGDHDDLLLYLFYNERTVDFQGEISYKIFNRTPFAHSILCWANAAVHANEDYQVIFPPGARLTTFHGKNQFARWPVSSEVYNGVDYAPGGSRNSRRRIPGA